MKFLREKRGFTQSELAQKAGYSERLIVKAESGRPISPHTVSDLAEALTTADAPVYPEDLTIDPVALARQYIDALYRHQAAIVDAIEHFLDPEVVFKISGDPEQIPFAGVHRGLEALRRGFEIFFSILEVPPGHDYRKHFRFVGQGNDVVAWGDSWIHPIGQPLARPMKLSHLLCFRRGKLILLEDIYDTHWAAKVIAEASSPESS